MTKQSSIINVLVAACLLLPAVRGPAGLKATPEATVSGPVRGLTLPAPGRASERHYTMTARVRPLLFWISRSGVGGARISWLESADGSRGLELLVGSDPARTPMRINRWGYV